MVKLKGPAVSTEAIGSIADVLSFQKGKRGTIAKKHAKPKQPRTGGQVSTRAAMKFLSQHWKTLNAAQMASWFNQAKQIQVANYHAYLAYNGTRYRHWLMPSKEYPASTAPYTPQLEFNFARSRIASVIYVTRTNHAPYNWGYLLCRSQTSGFTPGWSNAVALFTRDPAGWTEYRDTPLKPGTYYYRCTGFSNLGQPMPWHTEVTGVAQ